MKCCRIQVYPQKIAGRSANTNQKRRNESNQPTDAGIPTMEGATGNTPQHIGTTGTQHKLTLLCCLSPSVPNHGRIDWLSPADANVSIFQDTSFQCLVSEVRLLLEEKNPTTILHCGQESKPTAESEEPQRQQVSHTSQLHWKPIISVVTGMQVNSRHHKPVGAPARWEPTHSTETWSWKMQLWKQEDVRAVIKILTSGCLLQPLLLGAKLVRNKTWKAKKPHIIPGWCNH